MGEKATWRPENKLAQCPSSRTEEQKGRAIEAYKGYFP